MAPQVSLLSQIRSIITVDVDSMDPTVAIRHKPFCNMTSNQAIVYNQAIKPENASLIKEAISYVQAQNDPITAPDTYLREVVDVLTILLAKVVYPHLEGKVLVQTSPTFAYDTQKTIQHAQRLVSLFEAHEIPKSRVCIKIPATPEAIIACQALRADGINTLGTCIFSVSQSIAAAQAGCTYISPYFHELRIHFDSTLWKEYADTAREHPMANLIRSIIEALKGSDTLVIPASIITVSEVIALVSLRPAHLTIPPPLLNKMAELPEVPLEKFSSNNDILSDASVHKDTTKDYLVDGAVHLKEAFIDDPEISRKVVDALGIFGTFEKKIMEFIRSGTLDKEWDGQWP